MSVSAFLCLLHSHYLSLSPSPSPFSLSISLSLQKAIPPTYRAGLKLHTHPKSSPQPITEGSWGVTIPAPLLLVLYTVSRSIKFYSSTVVAHLIRYHLLDAFPSPSCFLTPHFPNKLLAHKSHLWGLLLGKSKLTCPGFPTYVWWQVGLHITLFQLVKTLLVTNESSPTPTGKNREINLFKSRNRLAFSLVGLRVLANVTVTRSTSTSGLYISLCWLHSSRLFP